MPFIERLIPKEWISPIAVQHTVESHMNETKSNSSNGNSQTQSSTTSTTANKRPESESVWSAIFANLDRLEQK